MRVVDDSAGTLPVGSEASRIANLAAFLADHEAGAIGKATHVYRQWGAIFDGQCWQVRQASGFVAVKVQSSQWASSDAAASLRQTHLRSDGTRRVEHRRSGMVLPASPDLDQRGTHG